MIWLCMVSGFIKFILEIQSKGEFGHKEGEVYAYRLTKCKQNASKGGSYLRSDISPQLKSLHALMQQCWK